MFICEKEQNKGMGFEVTSGRYKFESYQTTDSAVFIYEFGGKQKGEWVVGIFDKTNTTFSRLFSSKELIHVENEITPFISERLTIYTFPNENVIPPDKQHQSVSIKNLICQ